MKKYAVYRSPAKVNLFLKVVGKRPDGYHDIVSLMQPISLADEISVTVEEGNGIEVTCSDERVPVDAGNIAYLAAEAMLSKSGLQKKITIDIRKLIPVGAGLGGGSSNAATVIMALNEMLGAKIATNELHSIAASLGSDVPFFLLKSAALAKGRGEILTPVDIACFHYAIVNPGYQVSTAWVYNNLNLTKTAQDYNLSYSVEAFTAFDAEKLRSSSYNDLEAVTQAWHVEIKSIKKALLDAGAIHSMMSGSGPTVFGIFRSADVAKTACETLRSTLNGSYFIAQADGE